MYVRMYVLVMLRNVNLQYRFGMSIEVTPTQDIGYHVHYTTLVSFPGLPTVQVLNGGGIRPGPLYYK